MNQDGGRGLYSSVLKLINLYYFPNNENFRPCFPSCQITRNDLPTPSNFNTPREIIRQYEAHLIWFGVDKNSSKNVLF